MYLMIHMGLALTELENMEELPQTPIPTSQN